MAKNRVPMTLQSISEAAAAAGRNIDLNGCDYGPHKRSGLYLKAQAYYYFLAGFTQTLGMKTILEIGTSYGGSIMALDRGCGGNLPGVKLVTVDKTDIAGDSVKALTHIKRVYGNSLAPATLAEVKTHLRSPIDLLYIDSKHSYEHTTENLRIFAGEFHPHYVILDDIHLNPEMERAWTEIQGKFGEFAYDASSVADRPNGFGILDYTAANRR